MTGTDTQAPSDRVWRPYLDEPLLTPQMVLGLDHAAPADRERLIAFLSVLLANRGVPIHVNVAFNAAYFGFDLTEGSYVGGVELDDLVTVDPTGAVDALPVGAFIQVSTGSGPMLVEVLYKEGAHPDLGVDGYVPPWLSGAPAGATGPGMLETTSDQVVLRERVIVDVDAFGAGLSLTHTQVDRMVRRGRVVDPDGHLVLEARYPSRLEADMDESAYYARYLLTTARRQLLAAGVPMPLTSALRPGAGDEQLEAALVGLLETVQTALGRIEDARTWRGYAFARAGLAARLLDTGPLGGQDLRQLANQVEHAAVPSRRDRWAPSGPTVAYTAVGPLLRTFAGAGPGLRGLGYATAVCHANAVISDDARHEVDEDGLLPEQVHLRLDDAWQGGGVWRAERPGSAHRTTEVTVPLGLGWASTLPAPAPTIPAPVADPEPIPDEEADDYLDDQDQDQEPGTELTVTDSQVTWTHVLRLSHQISGKLPLPAPVVERLRTVDRPGVRMRLSLRHDGYSMDPADASQLVQSSLHQAHPSLDGVTWPLEYFAAIVLLCTWPRGAGVVNITSTLLPEPVVVDGHQIDHRYDPRALTRDHIPGLQGPGQATAPTSPASVVLGAVRAAGLLDIQGRATLARARVPDAVTLTYDAEPTFDVEQAIDELVRDGLLSIATASGTARRWHLPPVAGEPLLAAVVYTPRLTPGTPRPPRHQGTALHRWVAEAHVARHLRRIGHLGHKPSAEAAAAFRADHARFGLSGSAELPDGCTYVTEHERRYER